MCVFIMSCVQILCFDGSTQIWHQVIYFVVQLNNVMSGRLDNTCSAGCNICKCCIDTHLTFPALSCTSKTLSKIFLQILKLGLYFKSKISYGVWFLSKTMSPNLKFIFLISLLGVGIYLLPFSDLSLHSCKSLTCHPDGFYIFHHPCISVLGVII